MMHASGPMIVPQSEEEIAEFNWEKFIPGKGKSGKNSFSVVDDGTHIRGEYITRNAHVHGQIEGLIVAETVTVEKTGRILGRIFCRTLVIFGEVSANVVCDSISIKDDGVLTSTLKYKKLAVAPRGVIVGNLERRSHPNRQMLGRPTPMVMAERGVGPEARMGTGQALERISPVKVPWRRFGWVIRAPLIVVALILAGSVGAPFIGEALLWGEDRSSR
jgi:cytoskeletal protein CcmA (bactofilin family)